jgi:hypothetical protein
MDSEDQKALGLRNERTRTRSVTVSVNRVNNSVVPIGETTAGTFDSVGHGGHGVTHLRTSSQANVLAVAAWRIPSEIVGKH